MKKPHSKAGVAMMALALLGAYILGQQVGRAAAFNQMDPTMAPTATAEVVTQVVYQDRTVEKTVTNTVVAPECVTLAKRTLALTDAASEISQLEWQSAEIANRAKVFINLGDAAGLSRISADFRDHRDALSPQYEVIAGWIMSNEDLIAACKAAAE